MLGVLIGLAGFLEFRSPLNHDVAWILTAADLEAAGEWLYVTIIEINPPLIFWIARGMRWVGNLINVAPETLYRLTVLAVAYGSAAWVARLRGALTAATMVIGTLILVGNEFGQRDPLTLLLLAPTLAGASGRGAGVCAAVGIALKPQYALLWLLRLAVDRKWTRADAALISTGVMYIIAILLFANGWQHVVRGFGAAYQEVIAPPMAVRLASPTVLMTLSMVALWLIRRDPGYARTLAVAAVGAALVYVLQGKGNWYHRIPALTLAMMLGFELARTKRWMLALPLVVAISVYMVRIDATISGWRRLGTPMRAMLQAFPRGSRVVLLSIHSWHAYDAFRPQSRGLVWASTTPHAWWAAIPHHGVVHYFARRAAEDIRRADALLIEAESPGKWVIPALLERDSLYRESIRAFRGDTVGNIIRYVRSRAKE